MPIIHDALQGRLTTRSFDLDGRMFIGTPHDVPRFGWLALVAQRRNEAYQPLLSTLWVLAVGAIVLLLAIISVSVLSRNFSRLIERYAGQAHAIAGGDYDRPWPDSIFRSSIAWRVI
ncbi:MAG: hypothetical protein R3F37_20750 [Candidatus Competibacteraceae bacterium]